jgi:hypothetical protein
MYDYTDQLICDFTDFGAISLILICYIYVETSPELYAFGLWLSAFFTANKRF